MYELPTQDEIRYTALRVVAMYSCIDIDELIMRVANYYGKDATDHELQKRISWVATYLHENELTTRYTRGVYAITHHGREVLEMTDARQLIIMGKLQDQL